jgi:chemotaxis family two-component system sensor kinase Cph1
VKKNKGELENAGKLRIRADDKLKPEMTILKRMSDPDTQKLIHDLEVHQIELEMQNNELLKAQKELTESREKYSDLYDFAPVSYLTLDTKGLILEANNTAAAQLGVARIPLINTRFYSYVTKGDQDEFYLYLRKVFKTRSQQTCEIKLKGKNKTQFYAHLESIVVEDSEGKLSQCRTAISDITERKKAEEDLKATLKDLERSNKELEQFAYVASHDLQEPLRMVASYVQLLERRYKDKLDSDANEFIAYAADGANRMQSMINDLLDYSRVGTGGKTFEKTDCAHVFSQAIVNLQGAIEESGAAVTQNNLPTINADETQLIQLFQNLIDNALKFRGKEPPRIHVTSKKKGGEWLFSVQDNGIGIDSQYAKRVFVIFQRLHNRKKYPGTGIGLAICKRIVERHGGRIWVESEPGKGSTFFFTIPRKGDK